MTISFISDSLAEWGLDEMLKTAASLGVEAIEFSTGNWSRAPHLNLDGLLGSQEARKQFLGTLETHGITISALNCSGNPLAYDEHREVTRKTFELASLLGVRKIAMMSGLPSGCREDRMPVWVTTSWPPETQQILKYQWEEVAFPVWTNLKEQAQNCGIEQIALENHGWQLVYNPETMFRLRREIGPIIGMTLDPSHLFWMGGDPAAAVQELGQALFHVHAKDLKTQKRLLGPNGYLDTKPFSNPRDRSWNFSAVGEGHGVKWWRQFFSALHEIGYDGFVSIELEDPDLSPLEGLKRSLMTVRQAMGK